MCYRPEAEEGVKGTVEFAAAGAGSPEEDCDGVADAVVVEAADPENDCSTAGETVVCELVCLRIDDAEGAILESGVAGCIDKPFFGLIDKGMCF